jgi:acetolactate synthase-1/2/3 large subunit
LAGKETALLDALESALPDDAVVVADMCVAGYWYGGYGRVARPRGLAYPVGWGTLGFGFPAALGAAASGRPTVALVGDGGFLFACGELATAAQEQLPLTVVLVDDGGYGMLAYDFTKDGETPVGCDLEPPDFVALAHSFRVQAERVEVDGVAAALERHLALGAPSMIVVPAALTPPPNTSPRWYRAHLS